MDRQTTRIKLDTDYPRRPSPYLLHWMPITHTSAGGKVHTIWKDESQLPIDIDHRHDGGYSAESVSIVEPGTTAHFLAEEVGSIEKLKPGMFYLEPVDYEETLDYAPEDDPMYGVDVLTSDVTLNTAYPCEPIPYRIHWLPQPYKTKHGLKAMIWSREEGPPVRIGIDPSTLEEYFDEVIAKASDAFGGQENYQAYQVDNLEELERGTYYIERLETESSDNAEE